MKKIILSLFILIGLNAEEVNNETNKYIKELKEEAKLETKEDINKTKEDINKTKEDINKTKEDTYEEIKKESGKLYESISKYSSEKYKESKEYLEKKYKEAEIEKTTKGWWEDFKKWADPEKKNLRKGE